MRDIASINYFESRKNPKINLKPKHTKNTYVDMNTHKHTHTHIINIYYT